MEKPTFKLTGHSKAVFGVLVAVVVIAGALLLLHVNKQNGSSNKTSKDPKPNAAGIALQNNLESLGVKQVDLTTKAIYAQLDGTANAASLKADAQKNADEIGQSLGKYYGPDFQKKAVKSINVYIDQGFAYATAAKSNDETGKTAAKDKLLMDYAYQYSTDLGDINKKFDSIYLKGGLAQSEMSLTQLIDDHISNSDQQANDLANANSEMKTVYTYISKASFRLYSDKLAQ